jgi:RF-1 domain
MKSEKHLLFSVSVKDDCDVQTFRAGGKGGQHQNKTETGVRIIHRASGAVGESREERSQLINKQLAFKKMVATDKFKTWQRIETARLMGKPAVEEIVDQMMVESNIKFEVKSEQGLWVEVEAAGMSG